MEQEERSKETKNYRTADVIIVEGTLIFHEESVRDLIDLKIFLDTDEDIRLSRRSNIRNSILIIMTNFIYNT